MAAAIQPGARRAVAIVATAAARLEAAGAASPWLDAELLMAEAAGMTRTDVLAGVYTADAATLATFDAMIARRERREPVAYIVGRKEFFSLDFDVNCDVLIPRPETEALVTAALDLLAKHPKPRILDLGTGSGAIAVAVACNQPESRIVASDVSPAAIAVAQRNAARHRVSNRIEFRQADVFEPRDDAGGLGRFDLIVSNPPYVDDASLRRLEPEVRDFEPRCALHGGADGKDFYRRIAAGAREHLTDGGALLVEIGAGQADAVTKIFNDAALAVVDVLDDLAGHRRVVRARIGRARNRVESGRG